MRCTAWFMVPKVVLTTRREPSFVSLCMRSASPVLCVKVQKNLMVSLALKSFMCLAGMGSL